MLHRYLLTVFLLFTSFVAESKLPEIDSPDVMVKVKEIMAAHANYKELNSPLIKRILQNFLEELDRGKTYFTEEDIFQWLEPNENLLIGALENYKNGNYSIFFEIHKKMLVAIKRRNDWKETIESDELPKDVKVSEFKDLKWAGNEDQLYDRLLRLKALQLESAEKLDEEVREKSLQRIEKRRLNYEEDILTKDMLERKRMILSYILKATASALDAHTAYFTPGEATQFMIGVQQRLFGIGAQLRDDLNGFTVTKIIEGGPAFRGGELKAEDRIIAVDGEPVVGLEIIEAVELIRGEEGEAVVLSVLRNIAEEEEEKNEEKFDVKIVRGEVVLEDSRIKTEYEPYGDGVIAHITLYSFYQDPQSSSSSDLYHEIQKLEQEQNLKGIILDLRYNSGGILNQAVKVTGLFITKGIIVSTKDGDGNLQHLRDLDGRAAWNGPLIVLTNRASASAAEIVAQTLHDYGRAIIVGDDHTFGKGTFQTFSLDSSREGVANPQGEYKVTRGKYYTVSGKSPQLAGVPADIIVPGVLSEFDIGESFAKYPLENDTIDANFVDDLSDVEYYHRAQMMKLYNFDLQVPGDSFTKYVVILKKNSSLRIEGNKNYQNFLEELQNIDKDEDSEEEYGINDLQLMETINVMKDLILLMQGKAMPSDSFSVSS
ncbi:MAG: carboxyl-terminal processing protease [Chlamydiales bacterium]|jgi:carboxyl-terminal processing protease